MASKPALGRNSPPPATLDATPEDEGLSGVKDAQARLALAKRTEKAAHEHAELLRTPSPKAPSLLADRATKRDPQASTNLPSERSKSPARKPMKPQNLLSEFGGVPSVLSTHPAAASSSPKAKVDPVENQFANLTLSPNEKEDPIPREIESAIDDYFSSEEDDNNEFGMPVSPGSPRTTPPSIPETPVKKLTRAILDSEAEETFTPKRTKLLKKAEERILKLPLELVPQACERLINATMEVLERPNSGFTIFHSQIGHILGVTDLKNGNVCWFMRILKNISQRLKEISKPTQILAQAHPILLLDLTHILSLEATEGRLSVRGQHVHKNYLPNSCINPRSGVWCVTQQTESKLKKSKFSSNLPLQFQNEQQVTDLVNLAIVKGKVIVENNGRFLIQVNPDFFLEVVIRDSIRIPTIMPVLHCGSYDSKDIILDGYDGEKVISAAYQIPLAKLLPFIKQNTAAPLYAFNAEVIIDIAPFFKEAGIQCPVEKGILIRFPKTFFDKN